MGRRAPSYHCPGMMEGAAGERTGWGSGSQPTCSTLGSVAAPRDDLLGPGLDEAETALTLLEVSYSGRTALLAIPGETPCADASLAEAPAVGGAHAASSDSSAGPTADGDGPSGGLTANGDAPSEDGLRAMQRLYEHAKSKSDDIMLRHLRQRMIGDDRAKRDATSDAATFLRKRLADLEEDEAKRRKAELEEHWLAANDYAKLKIASEKQKKI